MLRAPTPGDRKQLHLCDRDGSLWLTEVVSSHTCVLQIQAKGYKTQVKYNHCFTELTAILEAVCHIGKVPVPCLRSEWHLPILLGREYRYIEYQRWKDYKYHPIQSSQPGNRAAWTTISASLLSHV